MKKILALTLLASFAGVSAHALDASGTAWACGDFGTVGTSSANATKSRFCTARITSATTATQLGSLTFNPNKQIWFVTSGPAAINSVSTTVNLKVRGYSAGTLNVSNSLAGNTAGFTIPYFDGGTVSVSLPGTISSTNAIVQTVIER